MKTLLALMMVLCCAGGAFATTYSLVDDYGYSPDNPNGVWSYGTKVETGGEASGVFDAFVAATIHDTSNSGWWDKWIVADTSGSCNVGKVPGGLWSFPAGSIIANAWTSYSAVAHITGVEAATYNLSADFTGGGYAAPTAGHRIVYVQKNGTTIWSSVLNDYITVGTDQQVTLSATDYLDFIVADTQYSLGEARASIDATLTLVPEPATMILLGMGGLVFLRDKYRIML